MTVIAIAGRAASGKTFIAENLGRFFGWPVIGFGRYVRKVAKERGLSDNFPTLQALGQSLVDADAPAFLQAVMRDGSYVPGRGAIVDGVRHEQILNALKSYVGPERVYLIYVCASEEARTERLKTRGMNPATTSEGVVERQAATLRAHADLVSDGEADVSLILAAVEELAQQKD